MALRPRDCRRPKSFAELQDAIRRAPRPVTLRATGHSLHDQALGEGTVLLVDDLPHRVVVAPNDVVMRKPGDEAQRLHWHTVDVTAWTPWEVVVRACLRLEEPAAWNGGHWDVSGAGGDPPADDRNVCAWAFAETPPRLIPYVLPSSGRITVGGSLSGDTMWRFSGCFGKESRSVLWLDLLVYRGPSVEPAFEILRLFNTEAGLWDHRELHDEDGAVETSETSEENDALFDAVIGGFGALGPIVRAKYLLLELDETITYDRFVRGPGHAERLADATDFGARGLADELDDVDIPGALLRYFEAELSEQPDGRRPHTEPPEKESLEGLLGRWGPSYPHASREQLGNMGRELEARALTWMRAVHRADAMFGALLAHLAAQTAREPVAAVNLPRKVGEDTVACFGLFFPNSRTDFRGVIANVAFGRPPAGAGHFKMWDRRYAWKNLGKVLWALPRFAGLGEWLAHRLVFRPCIRHTASGRPYANLIPEFALFMEGHSVALDEMAQKPKTIQQTWVIEVPDDRDGQDRAEACFVRFLKQVRELSRASYWSGDAIRIQICDVKAVPRGRALLSSCPDHRAITVTLAVEGGVAYEDSRWGDPSRLFRELSKSFWQSDRVRVHLTKNVHVDAADLRAMYDGALTRLSALRASIDPHEIWGSRFLDTTLRVGPAANTGRVAGTGYAGRSASRPSPAELLTVGVARPPADDGPVAGGSLDGPASR